MGPEIFKSLTRVNNHSIGENLHYPVTLVTSEVNRPQYLFSWDRCYDFQIISAKTISVFVQNTASLCENWIICNIGFKKNTDFSQKMGEKFTKKL
jgi:hypothetical protein